MNLNPVATSAVVITGSLPTGLRFTGDNRFRQEDQASRLRSMVDAMQPPSAPAPQPRPPAAAPAPSPAVRHCPVVAITSGKGGVGKTSTCVNLAVALAQSRFRATLLDADLGLANADVMCGITPTTRLDSAVDVGRPEQSLYGRPPQRRSLSQIAIEAPGGFRLVPGSVGISRMANLPLAQRDTILRGLIDLEQESDVVLIDTGAGLSDGVTSFAAFADLTIVIATPEPTSIADAYAMIKCIAQIRAARAPGAGFRIAVVINQAASKAEGEAVHARISGTSKRFLGIAPPLLGVLQQDPALPLAVRARRPVLLSDPTSKISKDLRTLSASLATLINIKPTEQPPSKRRKLFGWLRG